MCCFFILKDVSFFQIVTFEAYFIQRSLKHSSSSETQMLGSISIRITLVEISRFALPIHCKTIQATHKRLHEKHSVLTSVIWNILLPADPAKWLGSSGVSIAQWFSNFSAHPNHLRAHLKTHCWAPFQSSFISRSQVGEDICISDALLVDVNTACQGTILQLNNLILPNTLFPMLPNSFISHTVRITQK